MARNVGNLFSPEGMIMLPVALVLDITGIILVFFLLDDFFITDIIGMTIIGTWGWLRGKLKDTQSSFEAPDLEKRKSQAQDFKKSKQEKKAAKSQKAAKTAKSAKWTKWLKFLEFIPYVGALPFWTVSVYFTLTED